MPTPESSPRLALEFLDEGYYAEGPEWEAARSAVLHAASEASSIEELHAPLSEATTVAGGKHSHLRTPARAEESTASAAADFAPPDVATDSGVTTVTVPALGGVAEDRQVEYAEAAAHGIDAAADETCGWIVDLRGNTGGNMYPMLSGLAPLLPNGPAMSFVTNRGLETDVTVQDDGVGIGGDTVVTVPSTPKITHQPVAMLQDEWTASSGEAALTVFRGLAEVKSFGVDSAGYTSANTVHPLYDGAQIVLTGAVYVDRDGVVLDERPIPPDVKTPAEDAPPQAREWLRAQGCG